MNLPQLNVQPPNAMSGEPRVPPILPDTAAEDPLLGSLVVLAEHFGNSVPESSLVSGLPDVNGRLTPSLFAQAAARASLSARVIKRPLKDVRTMLLPAILLMNNAGAVVLMSALAQMRPWLFLRPELVRSKFHWPNWIQYTGYAICVKPEYRASGWTKVSRGGINNEHWFWSAVLPLADLCASVCRRFNQLLGSRGPSSS
jgi:ATP-binding cassette subfamily C protein LapB